MDKLPKELEAMSTARKKGRKQVTRKSVIAPPHPLPPKMSDAGFADYRTQFAKLEAKAAFGVQSEQEFIAAKLKLLRTHPAFHPADRKLAVEAFQAVMPETMQALADQPVPGGVGYGMFYNSAFKSSYATGTAITWEIICPPVPGGNVDNFLYITATNRTAKGVEAFVAYHAQENLSFQVFDWAQPDGSRFQVSKPFSELGQYLGTETVHGIACPVLTVMNTTYQQTPGSWVNEVRLLDVGARQWQLVYQFSYAATLQDQTGNWVGSWGPIAETFQDAYAGTETMGALSTQLISRDAAGNWGQWAQLTNTQSQLRTDNKGMVPLFVDPNFSWAVHS
jgi:hypothetical protein